MNLIKDIPRTDRPRERLMRLGAANLSLYELIAIVFRTGSHNASAIDLAKAVLRETIDIADLKDKTIPELATVKGVGVAKAVALLAAIELGRRINDYRTTEKRISAPKDAYCLLKSEMAGLKQEVLYALYLDLKTNLIEKRRIYVGSLNQSLIHPREVFKYAVKYSAYQILLVHNHPSGDPSPSPEDIAITETFIEIGKLMQIMVIDHVIIGDNGYVSVMDYINAKRPTKRPHL